MAVTVRGTVPFPPTADSRPINAFAGNLQRLAGELGKGASSTKQAAASAAAAWSGEAADGFGRHINQRQVTLDNASGAIGQAVPVLRTFAAAIDSTSTAYSAAATQELAALPYLPETAGAVARARAAEAAAVHALQAAGTTCAGALLAIEARVAMAELADVRTSTLDGLLDGDITFDDLQALWADLADNPDSPAGQPDQIEPPLTTEEQEFLRSLELASTDMYAKGGVKIPIWRILNAKGEVEAHAVISERADGTSVVELTMKGGLGASVLDKKHLGGELSGTASGEMAMEYRFSSRAEAQRFVDEFAGAVTPTLGEALRYGTVPSMLAADAAADGMVVLDRHAAQYETSKIALERASSAGIDLGDVAKIGVDGANSVEYDTADGTTTFAYELGGEAEARGLGLTGGGDGSLKVEFVAEGFDAKEIVISGDRQALGGVDVPTALGLPALPHGASVSMDATGGVQQTFKMTVPVTPENARLIQSMMLGGTPGAVAALPRLVDGSRVVVQANAVTSTKGGFDFVVVEGEAGVETSHNLGTWAKFPGQGWRGY